MCPLPGDPHPPTAPARRLRRPQALGLPDRAELHRTPFYDVVLRPYGVEHELELDIPSPPSHWKTFFFDRAERAFSERDRLVLDLLQPHLARLWESARTRRELAAALVGLDQAEAHESRGVILLGARGEVEYASEPARRLLREFAPDGVLVDWLASASRRPLVHHRGERRLIVERVGDALLLEEPPPDFGLTAREREVVTWVACGKTNAEIAQLLWLAPSTVSKHLENVYAKLGVNTRTAAVARFLGRIETGDGASVTSTLRPGIGRARDRMQIAGREALEAEGVEELRVLTDEHLRDLAPDADHLVAVVRVEDAVDVRPEVVEDREVVRGEGADAARARSL